MRIERRVVGTRVRVILNRTESREIGFAVLALNGRAVEKADRPNVQIRIGGRDKYSIRQSDYDKLCRAYVAERGINIPKDVDIRFAVDDNGQITGVTLQFFEIEK